MSIDDKKMFGAVPHGSTAGMTCARCESLVMDAMDGVLSSEDKTAFDIHVQSCASCAARLEEAKRGLAWLQMLRQTHPEPSADLVNRVLLATSGVPLANSGTSSAQHAGARIIPFSVGALRQRITHYTRVSMHPRLAMTAAMAFFSTAVTLNLFGVHVTQLRAGDLKPSNLRRTFWKTNQSVVRYYDNLRVVYELQSRVRELREDSSHSSPGPPPQPLKQGNDKQDNKGGKPHGGSSLHQTPGKYRDTALTSGQLLLTAGVQKRMARGEERA